jgi:hypothetical protein
MSMRDLIPWRRQENPAPALFRDEERSPYVQLRREMDRLFEDFSGHRSWAASASPAMCRAGRIWR